MQVPPSGLTIVCGVVQTFDPERRHGLIRVDAGGEVFFSWDGYRCLFLNQQGNIDFLKKGWTERMPKEGDSVVFRVESTPLKNARAEPWGYFDESEILLTRRHEFLTQPRRTVTARPKLVTTLRPVVDRPKLTVVQSPQSPKPVTLYRVVEKRESLEGWDSDRQGSSDRVRFVGILKDLNRLLPRPEDWRHDTIAPVDEDTEYRISRHFERNEGTNGRWTLCEDPRTIVSGFVVHQRFGR